MKEMQVEQWKELEIWEKSKLNSDNIQKYERKIG